jgi:hypothetical protein
MDKTQLCVLGSNLHIYTPRIKNIKKLNFKIKHLLHPVT